LFFLLQFTVLCLRFFFSSTLLNLSLFLCEKTILDFFLNSLNILIVGIIVSVLLIFNLGYLAIVNSCNEISNTSYCLLSSLQPILQATHSIFMRFFVSLSYFLNSGNLSLSLFLSKLSFQLLELFSNLCPIIRTKVICFKFQFQGINGSFVRLPDII
jgi:hypothetical protein